MCSGCRFDTCTVILIAAAVKLILLGKNLCEAEVGSSIALYESKIDGICFCFYDISAY